MNRRTILRPLMCGVFACFLVDSLSAQRRGLPIQVDRERPARTWEEAEAISEVTAVVRLTGRRFVSKPVGSAQIPTTVYKAVVLEVIRNAGPQYLGPVVEIERIGGIMSTAHGQMLVDEGGFPPWFVGTKLLLFLSWNKDGTMFVTGGPDAAFEVDSEGRARTFGKGKLAVKQNRRPFSELLAEVKERIR